ncbi:MAG: protein kinase [Phycisphaerales bacterium]
MTTPAQIGPYTIDRELGRGGMGVVYLATDPRLDRKVAIKALPEHLAQDPERLARFEREARLLASLTHPNIAGVYGLEETGGGRYLVMEYVEGPTLAEALARGPLALDEALRIAAQVASGVEAAHEAGVIHRDLKPGNIIVTADGKAKVLDFGLAKEVEGRGSSLDLSRSPTMTSPPPAPSHHTQAGQIMGTAAYLSPEQARGKRIDRRTDIWAFGCVLFEALTGASPYRGETITDSLGAILHKDPDWDRLPGDTPPTVRLLLRRCLTKDADRRLRDIGDARVEIEEFLRDPSASRMALAGEVPAATRASSGVGVRVLLPLVAVLAAIAGVSAWRAWTAPHSAGEPVRRFLTTLGGELEFATLTSHPFAITPDGKTLAFVARGTDGPRVLHTRRLDEFRSTARQGTEGAANPFFRPDGAWIGYFANGRIMKAPIDGGAPVTVCETPPGDFRGATWTDDGRIVLAPSTSDGLYIVPEAGGEVRRLTTLRAEERSHRWPHALPGSNAVLFTAQDTGSDFENATIEAVRLDSGEREVLHRGGSNPVYARSGHLLFGRSEGVFALPFDAAALRANGAPVRAIENVAFAMPNGGLSLSVSDDGVLVCMLGDGGDFRSLLNWADRAGARTPVGVEPQGIGAASLSPDGRRIALQIFRIEEGWSDLWVYEIARGVLTRLTYGDGDSLQPIWSPDGGEIAYTSVPRGSFQVLSVIGADGAGQRAIGPGDEFEGPTDWLDDGSLVFVRDRPGGEFDIVMRREGEGAEVTPIVATPADDPRATVSPDGRWIAYDSAASGRSEVFIRPFPDGAGRWQVSASGGAHPIWSPGGDELYFWWRNELYSASIAEADGTLRVGVPELLFACIPGGMDYPAFSVHPDGDRFLLVERDPTANPTNRAELAVTLNWFRELRERTGG